MMVNMDYAGIVNEAKRNQRSQVTFEQRITPNATSHYVDKITLSDQAMALSRGEQQETKAPVSYIKPESANSLLKKSATNNTAGNADSQFADMMQSILDKRLGVDREKLKEIEAMMKEIANNENLSAEEKQKALEELEKMKENLIAESLEIKKQAKKTFEDPNQTL